MISPRGICFNRAHPEAFGFSRIFKDAGVGITSGGKGVSNSFGKLQGLDEVGLGFESIAGVYPYQ